MRRSIQRGLFFAVLITVLNISFTNCAGKSSEEGESSLASSGVCGENLSDAIRTPTSIDQVVTLINSLPKPLTIDCFIKSLKRPLKVYSVNSNSSVQPAYDSTNPRIFIIIKNLAIAVVPKGSGRLLVEMSEKVSGNSSTKGELIFPIETNISVDAPYSRVMEGGFGTSCRVCHSNEGRYVNSVSKLAYQSNVITPLDSVRVDTPTMKAQAMFCNSKTDPYRCQMLRAIFIDGQAQDTLFP